jgi:fatty acid desaturase
MAEPGSGRIFAHSVRDLWLVMVSVLGTAALLVSGIGYPSIGPAGLILLFVAQAFLICTNYQCVAHNFTHNELFVSSTLNFLFSMQNSLALGFPQSIFKQHHLNHHRFNNRAFADDGVTVADMSSLYRYATDPADPEGFLRYSLLSPLRADILVYAGHAIRRGLLARLIAESALIILTMIAMLATDWRYLVFYYVPLIYVGHVLTYAEGYFEHNKAVPGDKMRNAASCYGRSYNMLWFNNGYHQEHHCYPQVHWTEIPAMREKMLPETERRVVKWMHGVNL